MADVLLGIGGRVEVGETLTAVALWDGVPAAYQWQALIGGGWVNVGVASSQTYVVPSNAVGMSYRLVATSGGQTFYSAVTGAATQDTSRAAAPTLAGNTPAATVQENAAAAALFSSLAFTDADKANYTGGSLLVLNTQNGSANLDMLSIRFAGTGAGQFSYDAATRNVLYAFSAGTATVVGTIDAEQNGNGTSLKVVFNASATKAVVDSLIDNVTFANNDDSPTLSRLLTLRVTDPTGASAQRVLAVNVAAQADAPVFANATAFTVDENQTSAATLAATDPDQEANAQQGMTFSLVAGAADNAHFTVDAATGVLRFESAPDFEDATHVPQYTVRVRATDAGGTSSEQTLTITLRNVNDAPVAQDIAATAQENGPAIMLAAAFTDQDAGDGHTTTVDTSGTIGMVTRNGDVFSYDAAGRFEALAQGVAATDAFSYTVTDNAGASSTRTATITIVGSNDGPQAQAISAAAQENGPAVALAPLFTDPDAQDSHTITLDTSGTVGAVVLDGQSFSYSAAGRFESLGQGVTATDTFQYTVTDSGGLSSTRAATVMVVGSNDAPLITGGVATGAVTEAGVLDDAAIVPGIPTAQGALVAGDVDQGDTLTWFGSAAGTYGAFSVNSATGDWTYTLSNNAAATQALNENQWVTETFNVTVRDGQGLAAQQQVTVNVQGANDLPDVSAASNLTGVVHEPEAVLGTISLQFYLGDPAVDLAGRLLFSAWHAEADSYAVARLNTNGSLDTSYGSGGYADLPGLVGVATDSLGRVLGFNHGGLVRIDAAGNRDLAFGDGGRFVPPSPEGSWNSIKDVVKVHGDGTIDLLFVERDGFMADQFWSVLRLHDDGSVDTTFGDQGKLLLHGPGSSPWDVEVDGQGRFILQANRWDEASSSSSYEILRYLPDGTLDTSFGDAGTLVVDDLSESMTSTAQGLVLFSTQYTGVPTVFAAHVTRLDEFGQPDATFGNQGHVILPFDVGTAVAAVDSQGRIVVAFNVPEYDDFNVTRLSLDGTIDTSFGINGFATADFGGRDNVEAIFVRPDDSIVLKGWTLNGGGDTQLASFDASGRPDERIVGEDSDAPVLATGLLFVDGVDPDAGDTLQWGGSAQGVYGEFTLDPQGNWTYVLDKSSAATQALDEGQLAYETFTATLTDSHGAQVSRDVVITIVGSYDPPTAP